MNIAGLRESALPRGAARKRYGVLWSWRWRDLHLSIERGATQHELAFADGWRSACARIVNRLLEVRAEHLRRATDLADKAQLAGGAAFAAPPPPSLPLQEAIELVERVFARKGDG